MSRQPVASKPSPNRRPADSRLWTSHQVARHLGLSPNTVRRWVAEGRLPAYRVGRVLRFDPADLDKFAQKIGA